MEKAAPNQAKAKESMIFYRGCYLDHECLPVVFSIFVVLFCCFVFYGFSLVYYTRCKTSIRCLHLCLVVSVLFFVGMFAVSQCL